MKTKLNFIEATLNDEKVGLSKDFYSNIFVFVESLYGKHYVPFRAFDSKHYATAYADALEYLEQVAKQKAEMCTVMSKAKYTFTLVDLIPLVDLYGNKTGNFDTIFLKKITFKNY